MGTPRVQVIPVTLRCRLRSSGEKGWGMVVGALLCGLSRWGNRRAARGRAPRGVALTHPRRAREPRTPWLRRVSKLHFREQTSRPMSHGTDPSHYEVLEVPADVAAH